MGMNMCRVKVLRKLRDSIRYEVAGLTAELLTDRLGEVGWSRIGSEDSMRLLVRRRRRRKLGGYGRVESKCSEIESMI